MNSDLIELLHCLNEFKVKYLIIGGHAVIHYSEPRYTKDLDIWVAASATNAKRLIAALNKFGAPVDNLSVQDFIRPGTLFVFGLPPNRVDILNRIKGSTFANAYKRKSFVLIAKGLKVAMIGLKELLAVKQATARPQDLIDAEKLKVALKKTVKKRIKK